VSVWDSKDLPYPTDTNNLELLNHIIQMWNVDGYSEVVEQHLELILWDIYFLTILTTHGDEVEEKVTLWGHDDVEHPHGSPLHNKDTKIIGIVLYKWYQVDGKRVHHSYDIINSRLLSNTSNVWWGTSSNGAIPRTPHL
jgi:hypothetical protein